MCAPVCAYACVSVRVCACVFVCACAYVCVSVCARMCVHVRLRILLACIPVNFIGCITTECKKCQLGATQGLLGSRTRGMAASCSCAPLPLA